MRVLVLGAGFGGLELTTRLSDELGDAVEVVLIDQAEAFVFGFSKLDVMFGRTVARRRAPPLPRPGEAGRAVRADHDPLDRSRPSGGSRPTPAPSTPTCWSSPSEPTSTRRPRPGWSKAATSSTRCPARSPLRDVLAAFDGGRVVVGVTSTPFKCPPAPSETALLMHDYLTERGLPGPLGDLARHAARRSHPAVAGRVARRCSPLSPSGTSTGIPTGWCAQLDPARKVARLADGGELPVRPVPRRAGAPGARGGRGVGPVRRRLDPGGPAHARDGLPRRLRRR